MEEAVWGRVMRKILYSRLPERVAHRVPPLLVELAVGIAAAVAMGVLRVTMSDIAGGRPMP